ncbi:hypothetical protein PAMP_019067 [Pampus punctatissimus]
MAAKEDIYSKIIPRRLRQNRSGSVKSGSNLDVLLSMGFPRPRAENVQTKNDRVTIFS